MPNLRKLRQRRDITNIPAARRPIKREAYELPQEALGREMDPAFETLAEQELEERAMPAERMSGPSTILERVVYKELWDLGYRPPDLDFQSSMLGARFSYQFGRQVADFAIHSLGIVIEVQGQYWHGNAEQQNRDAERELQLRAVPRDPPWRAYYLEESVVRNRMELWLWLLEHVVFGGPRDEWRASAAVDPHSTRPVMPVTAEEQPGGVPGTPGETPVGNEFKNLNPTNHVINGGFDHDSTRGWTSDSDVSVSVVNGKLQLNATVADRGVYQTISNLEPSGTYYLSVTVEAGGNSARWYTTGGLVNPDKTVSSSSETVSTALCQASAVGTLTIHLVAHTTGVDITFDDVILVRGNHAWAWGVHPHADTVDGYHADAAGTADAHVVATDANGVAIVAKVRTSTLDTASGNMELTPAGDLIFDPVGNDLLPETNYDLNIGAINKKYLTLHAAELWVETLVAQDTIATIGGRILVGPTTTLTRDLASGGTTIYVKHNEMAVGDRAYLEANAKIEFLAITGGPTLQGAGDYAYSVTRNLDGSGANVWYAGDAVFNTGTTGEGFIDLYSLRGVKSATQYGPTIVGNVRNSATYNDWSEHWAIGNLNGIYGYGTTTYGAAFGKYANNQSFLTADATNGIRILKRASDTNTVLGQWATDGTITIGQVAASQSNVLIGAGHVKLRNNETDLVQITSDGNILVGQNTAGQSNVYITAGKVALRTATTEKIALDSSGNISLTGDLAVGTSGAIRSGATAVLTGNGYWLDYNAGTPRFRVGTVSGGALAKGLYWDGSNLQIKATNTTLDASGNLTASSATLSGSITASSGAIGGFTIGASTISATNLTLTSGAANAANITVGTGSTAGGLNSAAASGDIAIWAGSTFANRASAPFRVTAGGALTATSATLSGAITATSGSFTGKITMSGASSAIAIGATPPTSSTAGTGIWIDRTGMYGLASSVLQAKFDAVTGAITAGAGNITLAADGLKVNAVGSVYDAARAISWLDGATSLSTIYGKLYTGSNEVQIECSAITGNHSTIHIAALAPSGKTGMTRLSSGSAGSGSAYLDVIGNTNGTGLITLFSTNLIHNGSNAYFYGGLNLGTATGAGAGQIKAENEIIAGSDAGFQLQGYMREFCGEKAIGDNTATTIFYVNVTGTYQQDTEGLLVIDVLLDASGIGYAVVAERWLVALRAYTDGAGTKSFGAGTPVRVATSDAGSASSGWADVGSGALTVTPVTASNRFDVKMQADATGAFGGGVTCRYRAQLSPMRPFGSNMSYMTLTAA